jgi:hypothetical protein
MFKWTVSGEANWVAIDQKGNSESFEGAATEAASAVSECLSYINEATIQDDAGNRWELNLAAKWEAPDSWERQ